MRNIILALNAGSTSLKFSLFVALGHADTDTFPLLFRGTVQGLGTDPGEARFLVQNAAGQPLVDEYLAAVAGNTMSHEEALRILLEWIEEHTEGSKLSVVGHRVVHGGTQFVAPVLVSPAVLNQLEEYVPLAPLHQPHNLAAIRIIATVRPDLPQVACFDTAFHRTLPPVAQAFALPRALTAQGIRRYGFHGLSYEYIARVLPSVAGQEAMGRAIVAHLGGGASMCALQGLASRATTTGFTALDGLPMGTRCGALDPGVLLHLLGEQHMDIPTVTDLLYHRSGLLGVSGESSDMQDLLVSNSPHAREAIDLFVYRIELELGALAAALGGLDVLVFTGGIGEHAAPIRARVCQDAWWLGVRLDEAANAANGPKISTAQSAVSVWVIPTNEDAMIAWHTSDVVSANEK